MLGGIPFEYEGIFCDNENNILNLCSVDCLQSNGISLLLKTKLVPISKSRFDTEAQKYD